MRHDALGAHARDEIGISETMSARPVQAALASAASFAIGAALPLVVAALVPSKPARVGLGHIARVYGRAGPRLRKSWWCQRSDGRMAGHVLGRACHGDHGRGRRVVRCCRVTIKLKL